MNNCPNQNIDITMTPDVLYTRLLTQSLATIKSKLVFFYKIKLKQGIKGKINGVTGISS